MTRIFQLDYSEYDVGRNNPESKREVNFKFDMDGEEYDVQLRWSFASGRRTVIVNGREVFFGKKGGASVLDEMFSFGGIEFHLVGTRAVPKGEDPYDYNAFELFINGILFSMCPRPGELGVPKEMGPTILDLLYPKTRYTYGAVEHQLENEEKRPVQPKVQPEPQVAPPPPPPPVADLLGFDDPAPTAAVPLISYGAPTQAPAPLATAGYNNYTMPQAQEALFGAPTQTQFSHPQLAADPFFGAPTQCPSSPRPQQAADPFFGAPTQCPSSPQPQQVADPFFGAPAQCPSSPQPQQAVNPFFGAPTECPASPPQQQQAANTFGVPSVAPQQPMSNLFSTPVHAANPFGAAMPAEAPPPPPAEDPPPPPSPVEESSPWGNIGAQPAPSRDPFGAVDPWTNHQQPLGGFGATAPMVQPVNGNVGF